MEYTVVNSTVSNHVTQSVVDGQPAEIHQKKRVVEMIPSDGLSGTIKLVLPVTEDSETFPEDAKVNVTFAVVDSGE